MIKGTDIETKEFSYQSELKRWMVKYNFGFINISYLGRYEIIVHYTLIKEKDYDN